MSLAVSILPDTTTANCSVTSAPVFTATEFTATEFTATEFTATEFTAVAHSVEFVPVHDTSFTRKARLLDGASFEQVFNRNLRVSNAYWIVLGHKSGDTEARMGLAIAKKKAKRAVDRNRLKRIARESFRHSRESLHGFDIVVMNKHDAVDASTAELRSTIDGLWADLCAKALRAGVRRA